MVAQLTQAIEAHQHAHPGDDFALGHPRDHTLHRRFQALFFAPLFGIETRTAFATHEPPLATLLGQSYPRSTLTQCLGQLERVGADEALLPTLRPAQAGHIISIDGHMSASWSRVAMSKGTITMRGRIMAGSQAVIAHNEAGHALFVASHPPDIPWSRIIVAYSQQGVEATGSTLFVIDRAVNALAIAAAFADQDWGWLCMLEDHEPHGRESFEATSEGTLDDGTQVERGSWTTPKDDDEPRHCVIVEPTEGQTVVSWGTPKLKAALEATEWPRVSRERTEMQDNSFKRMIDHGALETTDGRKKIVGPDRHQQRTRESLAASVETAQQQVAKKVEALQAHLAKGEESTSTGQSNRLEQRQQALVRVEQELEHAQNHQAKLVDHVDAFGPPKERADRDCRQPTIMTCRTVLLEQALMACMAVLLGSLQSTGS
jgi:hypothetical protein